MKFVVVSARKVYSFKYTIADRTAKYVTDSLQLEDVSVIDAFEQHSAEIIPIQMHYKIMDVPDFNVLSAEDLNDDISRLTVQNTGSKAEFPFDVLKPIVEEDVVRQLLVFFNSTVGSGLILPTINFKH